MKYKRSQLRTSLVRVGFTVLVGVWMPFVAQAQNPPRRVVETIDVRVLNTDTVVVGKIEKIEQPDRQHAFAWIVVEEVLKGTPQDRLQRSIDATQDRNRELKQKPRVLVTGQSVISLGTKDLSIRTASGEVLKEPNKVMEYVREVIRTHPGVNQMATYNRGGTIVPLDERLEKWAIDDIRAGRVQGFDALKSFKSPANAAFLQTFLNDPRFTTLSAEYSRGSEIHTYDVRQKAYEILRGWAIEVPEPVLREEIPRLATVERLHWRGPIEDNVLVTLADAQKLKFLEIASNDLRESQMPLLGRITSLTRLKLAGLPVTDSGLKELRSLTNLQDLEISLSRITDKGLVELSALRNLKNLTLKETRVTDEGLAVLTRFQNLKWLDVTLTQVTQEGFAAARRVRPDLNFPSTTHSCPSNDGLSWAAYCGNMSSARFELDWKKVDPNRADRGAPAIFFAVSQNHIEVLRYLLKYKANVDALDTGKSTPLQWAALHGYIPILKLLMRHGANVNHSDEDENTPLHFAAKKGSPEVIRRLLSAGANRSARNKDGSTPLDLAKMYGRANAINILR